MNIKLGTPAVVDTDFHEQQFRQHYLVGRHVVCVAVDEEGEEPELTAIEFGSEEDASEAFAALTYASRLIRGEATD